MNNNKNKRRAWEDEPTWKMTTNTNKIYNDKHASKHHKEVEFFFVETQKNSCIEFGTLDLKLPFVINCHKR